MGNLSIADQVKQDGLSIHRQCFSSEEIVAINEHIARYIEEPHPGIVREDDRKSIRGIHGPHLYDNFFRQLVADPRLLGPAEEFLGEPCYVHQFKINMKQRMKGEAWPWHQDYIFWKNGDGIPRPNLINVAILLNDVDMLHGPLCLIPGSHKFGDLSESSKNTGDWEQDLSKDLTYQIGHADIDRLVRDNGVKYLTGEAGDVALFDPMVAHSSSVNLSPQDRVLLIVTYNTTSNTPRPDHNKPRPEFLSARDFRPLHQIANRRVTDQVIEPVFHELVGVEDGN
ncbi:phytanoyl-CoA dioxygenase family protein [Microbulbifer sp. GL-2]|uniref:phytanoyl-CoA dioxygenase family protein n=1 Tax=Microbulbifer sp. GL-2 TaxID=2591606 RepID=UPI001164C113|nr:phytanoyl-CoA dioxygenase family protein [Microbulbifer sp. GL-2]BBM00788.1 L-proline 4-hydroxylase [Microbulbifer sp. GL-2]